MSGRALITAAALAVALGACRGEEVDMSTTIQEARAMHTDSLMAKPGVVSVGIGLDTEGNPAIVVGLDQERPEVRAQIPETLEGHNVVVQVIGEIRAH